MRRPLLFIGALLALAACGGVSPGDELVEEAHEAVKAKLRDPESARLNDQDRAFVFPDRGLMCGRVNSKNGFGGYAGETLNAYSRAGGAHLSEEASSNFDELHGRCLEGIAEETR